MGRGGGFQVSLIYAELRRGLDGANRRCQLSDDIVAGHGRRGEENTVRGCLIPYPGVFCDETTCSGVSHPRRWLTLFYRAIH